MLKKIISCLMVMVFCFTAFAPVTALAASSARGADRNAARIAAHKKAAAFQKKKAALQKRNEARRAIGRQKKAIAKQKIAAARTVFPVRGYLFTTRGRTLKKFRAFYAYRIYVMELEQLKEFFGIKKVNEMMENGEIVEDNTVVVDKDGNFVGINDDTLDKDAVILDENGNPVKNFAGTELGEGTYNPNYQFMHNGKIYNHGYYRGMVNQMIRIMPADKWIEYIGMDAFTQKVDSNEITADNTGFFNDEGKIVAMSDLSLDLNHPAFDEFNRIIPNVAKYQIPDPVDAYGYFHGGTWKCKHGFYMVINKGIVHVQRSEEWVEELGPKYFSKAIRAEMMYRLPDKDVITDINGKILAIHQNQLPKESVVLDKDGNKIQVLHDGETYQPEAAVTAN